MYLMGQELLYNSLQDVAAVAFHKELDAPSRSRQAH